MKRNFRYLIISNLLILFVLVQIKNLYSQNNNMESVSDDWQKQTANYVVVGYTTDNPNDYVWSQVTNQLQGVHIYVNPSEIVPIYIQLNNNVINFSTRAGYDYAYTHITQIKVSVNNGDYIELYSGGPKQDVVWFNSSNYFNTLGSHLLQVNIVDEFGRAYNREYHIKVIPSSDALYRDNYGNTLRLWKGNNTTFATPVVFSEGFDAYDTNPQEMYYYAAKDLIECMKQNGFDIFLLNNKFGTQDIRNNAAGFSAAVRYVSSLYNGIKVIAGGVSMGGMIARYAFAKEEGDGHPLPASVFISVDSPQQGAVISKPLQDYKKEKQAGDGFAEHALNNDAAKQLLNYCTYDPSGDIHTEFYAELNALNGNGYPHNTQKNIGISFSTNNPNPNQGKWMKIEWHIDPFSGEVKNFYLTEQEKVAGSFLPIDLTTMDPMVILATYWWAPLLFPIIPLHYPTITFERTLDPTYIPHKSALDIVDNNSKFDVTIVPNHTTHHDELPPEVIDPIVTELLLINKYIQNVDINYNINIVGKSILAGNHVTNGIPYGDVNINNTANVGITASESIVLKEGVKINEGAFLSLSIDPDYSSSCRNNKRSMIINQRNKNKIIELKKNNLDNGFKIISRSKHNDFNMINKLIVFPNPTNGKFTLSAPSLIKSVYIYNAVGELVLSNIKVGKNNLSFDICKQKNGFYYLKIFTGQNINTLKIVKF